MARRWLPLVSLLALAGLVLGPAARTLCAMSCLRPAESAARAVSPPGGHHGGHVHHAPATPPAGVDHTADCGPLPQRPCEPPAVAAVAASPGGRHLAGDAVATLAMAPRIGVGAAPRLAAPPPERRTPPPGPPRAPLPLRI